MLLPQEQEGVQVRALAIRALRDQQESGLEEDQRQRRYQGIAPPPIGKNGTKEKPDVISSGEKDT